MTSPSPKAASGDRQQVEAWQAYRDWERTDEGMAFVSYGSPSNTRGLGFSPEEEAMLAGDFGVPTNSGQFIGADSALKISAAYACRRVISEDVAKLPRRVTRRWIDHVNGVAKDTVQTDHPVHALITQAPNDWMTAFEFWQYMIGVATFHNGAYAIIQRDEWGRVTELLPLLPGCVGVETDQYWRPSYRVTGYGEHFVLEAHQVLRIHGPMRDPFEGVSTIWAAREAIGVAAAIEASQARFHANDLRPSGILTAAEKTSVSKEQRETIQKAWAVAYGSGGTGGVAVLDAGWDFKAISAEGVKQEVIENRKFQVSEIARFFRVAPVMIGHNDGSQSYSSIEAQQQAHKEFTLDPWVRRVEEAATMQLLTWEEREAGYRVDIDMDALMRGTPSDRAGYYERATKVWMTPNEARVREGLPPLDIAEMNRPQLAANNTGLMPSLSAAPREPDILPPAKPAPRLPKPKPGLEADDEGTFRHGFRRLFG
jgi:HK97 family phage portal protein